MRIDRLIPLLAAMTLCLTLAAQNEPSTFIPAKNISAGAQFAYTDLNTDNTELYLLIHPVSAKGQATLIAPFVEYAYRDDRALGLRFSYLNACAQLDHLTLDLLNDGLQLSLSDMSAHICSYGGTLYHRNYFGLDRRNLLAAFAEVGLNLTGDRSDFGDGSAYSSSFKAGLTFSPGLIFFVMDHVAASCSVSMGGVSYRSVKCYSNGVETGHRAKFGSRFGLDLLGINFGISFYLSNLLNQV